MRTPNGSAMPSQRRWVRELQEALTVLPDMENKPKQPDELPADGSISSESAEHVEHGIPPAVHDDEPTGLPNSDRHHGEVTPTKP
jgi:GMP synthase-like glutamine amidotransferase